MPSVRSQPAAVRPHATDRAHRSGLAGWATSAASEVKRAASYLRDSFEPAKRRDAAPSNVPAGPFSWDGGRQWQPGVEELQRALVAAGYMTAEELATGPGFYGPRTRAAVARMNAEHGLSGDGSNFGGAEAQRALSTSLTTGVDARRRKRAEEEARGGPGARVAGTTGAPLSAGEVPLIDQRWPNGASGGNYWNGNANCGPTSAAMVARALGLGGGMSDAALVMQLGRAGGTTAAGSSPEQVAQMMRSLGVSSHVVEDPSLAQLDAALAWGKPVIVNGDYFATGVNGRNGAQESGHFCVVTGRDANGNYIVNDPWMGQRVVFSPQAMTNFFREHAYNGALVVVG